MNPVIQALLVALVPFVTASIPFWVFLKNRTKISDEERHMQTRLLLGLAQTNVIYLGMKYIERGWVSKDEYDDLQRYLYEPYHKLGGNGTVERIMHAVQRLPLKTERSVMEAAFMNVPIRETDPTGIPSETKPPYEGEDRRGKHRRDTDD